MVFPTHEEATLITQQTSNDGATRIRPHWSHVMRVSHEIHPHDSLEQNRFAHGLTYEDIGGCGCDICTRARKLRAARPSEPAGESDRAKIERLTPAQRSALLASLEREHAKVPARPVLTSNVDPDAGMKR